MLARGLFSPSDVAGTVAQEQYSVRDDFLRVACSVCGRHGENHHERRVVGPGKVVRDESSSFVVVRKKSEAERSGDVRAKEQEDEPASSLPAMAAHVVVQEHASEDRYRNDAPVGYLH